MADFLHADPGGAATFGLEFLNALSGSGDGTVDVDSGTTIVNPRSIHLSRTSGAATAAVFKMANAGRRLAVLFRTSALPAAGDYSTILRLTKSTVGEHVLDIRYKSDGRITIREGAGGTAVDSASAGLIAANTNYIIAVSYVITSTTNWTMHVWVGTPQANNLTLAVSATNANFTLPFAGESNSLQLVVEGATSYALSHRFEVSGLDNGSDLAAIGDIACTTKQVSGDSSVNWDTAIGSDPGAGSRFQTLDDRPADAATGRQQASSSQASEDYDVQAAAAGDVDISAKTVVGAGAWIYAKDGSSAGAVPALRGAAVVPTGNPTTGGTVGVPASVAADDILILPLTSRDHTAGTAYPTVTDNDTGGNAWQRFAESADRKATWWWKRATSGTASKTVTVAGAVGSCSFVLKCFSGCITTGDPFTNVVVETNASADETHATFTPTNGYSMVLAGVHNYGNDNAVTSLSFATLGATTATEKLSTGGSDCATAFGHVAQSSSPTATGALTWAQADGTTYSITCALVSASPGVLSDGTPQIRMDGSDLGAVDLTGVAAAYSAWRTSASYPSTVGMKSTGTAADTFLYELGAIVIYTPTVGGTTYNETVGLGASGAIGTARNLGITQAIALNSAGGLSNGRQLSGNAAIVLAAASALAQQGQLALTQILALANAAGLTQSGGFNLSQIITLAVTAGMSPSRTVTLDQAIAFAASAQLQAARQTNLLGTVALPGSAQLAHSATLVTTRTVSLASAAVLAVALGGQSFNEVLSFIARPNLATSGTDVITQALTLSSSAHLAPAAQNVLAATLVLSGIATLTGTGGRDLAALVSVGARAALTVQAQRTLAQAIALQVAADIQETATAQLAAQLGLAAGASLPEQALLETTRTLTLSVAALLDAIASIEPIDAPPALQMIATALRMSVLDAPTSVSPSLDRATVRTGDLDEPTVH